MHSAAAIYSLTLGDPKFLEIYYLLECGVVTSVQPVYFVCYHVSIC